MAPTSAVFTLDFIREAIKDIVLSRYLSGSAVTLVVYDWLLLLEDESQTILQAQWTVPKALYYFIRILTLPFICLAAYELSDMRPPLSKTFCTAWPTLVTVPVLLTIGASNWLFTLRLLALYKRRRILVWFMRVFYVATYAVTLTLLISALVTYGKTVDYYPIINACGALEASDLFPAMFYAPAAYEAFIFALTLYQAWKDQAILTSSASPFLLVLYRDELICFLVMVGMRSWNIWIYTTQPISSLSIGGNIMWAFNTVLSTRVYLNLVWHAKGVRERSGTLGQISAGIDMQVPTTILSFSTSMECAECGNGCHSVTLSSSARTSRDLDTPKRIRHSELLHPIDEEDDLGHATLQKWYMENDPEQLVGRAL